MSAPKLTVDEVASSVGLPSTTIRYYQQQGLIDAPTREGRRAYYGQRHIDQLMQLGALTERGFSLAAIKEMRRAEAEGKTLGDLLHSPTLAESQRMVEMSLEELAASVLEPGQTPSPEQFTKSLQLGIVELTESGTVQVHVEALELGREIRRLGIPRDEVLDRHAAVRDLTDEIAEILVNMYEIRREDAGTAAADYEKFVVLARRTVDFAFLRSLEELRRRRIEEESS